MISKSKRRLTAVLMLAAPEQLGMPPGGCSSFRTAPGEDGIGSAPSLQSAESELAGWNVCREVNTNERGIYTRRMPHTQREEFPKVFFTFFVFCFIYFLMFFACFVCTYFFSFVFKTKQYNIKH